MKTLILTRHAKSSWDDATQTDFQRPLNPRGLRDVPMMGERLHKRALPIDLLLSSTAARAIATASLLRQKIQTGRLTDSTDDSLYEASTSTIIDVISAIPENIQCALLVGHNPGFSDTTNHLCGQSSVSMPTCAMACLELDIDRWAEAYRGCAILKWYDYPKLVSE